MNENIIIGLLSFICLALILGAIMYYIHFFKYKIIEDSKEKENKELKELVNSLSKNSNESKIVTEQYLKDIKDSNKSVEKDILRINKGMESLSSVEKDISNVKERMNSLEKNSKNSTDEITSLFSNGKTVGQIGEDYLYSTLIKLDCEDISSNIDLIEDKDILTYLVQNEIKFAFKRQYLLKDGSIPDCVVFTAIKINDEEFMLKKIIIDSKAIINALKLDDGESLVDRLSTQMKGLAKKEYFKNVDESFNNVILFFPFIGVLDLLKSDNFKAYKDMLESFREKGIIFSTAENIYLTLEIILDGYNTHQLQESSKSKQEVLDKADELVALQKQYKHGLKERINTSDALKYIGGTIKREIAIYQYMLQFEDDVDNNEEIQSVLKEIKNFK